MKIVKSETIDSFKKNEPFSYYPSVGFINNKVAHAFIRTYPGKDVLVLNQNEIYQDKYLLTPVICCCKIIFSGCDYKDKWYLGIWDGNSVKRTYLRGRVNFIRSEIQPDGNNTWFSFELRNGKHTQAYIGTISSELVLYKASGNHNAYDPHAALSKDGFMYVVYGSFISGNYHILLSKLTQNGEQITVGEHISDRAGMCMYPSVCPAKSGGVWLAYTGFTVWNKYEDTYMQYSEYRMRRSLFMNYPQVYYARYKDDTLFVPIDKKNEIDEFKSGYMEPFIVEGACAAKYPVISEAFDGSLSIVYTYNKTGPYCWFACPNLMISTLGKDGWSSPQMLLDENLHEYYASVFRTEKDFVVTSMHDCRIKSGWYEREWHDNTTSVPLKSFSIETDTYDCDNIYLHKHFPNPTPIYSMEEKPFKKIKRNDGKKIAWGQTHKHTNHSVCCRLHDQSMITNHRFYQDVLKSDFGTTTDHGYNMWPLEIHLNHKMADYLYFKGQYVAFPAYEWTCGYSYDFISKGLSTGHYNPLYLEETGRLDYYTPFDPDCGGHILPDLWNRYSGRQIVTVPHHPADNSFFITWNEHNEQLVPVVEIFQDFRGQHEQPDVYGSTFFPKFAGENSWVLCALKKGIHLGFIAGGDHLGQSRAGLEVSGLTRTELYNALMERRTYAGSGAGADLEFTCNDKPVGSKINSSNGNFSFKINTTESIKDIQFVKNGITLKSFKDCIEKKSFSFVFSDTTTEKENFYYVRILLKNGEVFWTSPIWIICD